MIMAVVAEDFIASGKEPAASHGVLIPEYTAEINQQDHKQQPPLCEPNKSISNAEATSRTYTDIEDTFQKNINGNPHIEDSDNGNSSYYDLLLTACVPLIPLWFRRSMFGPANLIRSIVVGQLMRLVFVDNISKWIAEKLPPWLEVILFQSSATGTITGSSTGPVSMILGAGSKKIDPHAWPPPAFTALALLTIFALVVHPDGLTWIVLGKLRDAICATFSAFGQCLEFLLNDYGVFPTIIAATTLVAMFFMVFVVIRTLSPKKTKNNSNKHNNTLHNERKKKKKKGGNARHRKEHHHHHNHHRSNRIKFSSRSQSDPGEDEENDSLVASPCSPMPSPPPSEIQNNTSPSPSLHSKNTIDSVIHMPSLSAPSSTIAINIESNERIKFKGNDKVPISNGANKSKENRTRRRMMSGSTSDTTPLSDDQSCGSISVRSYPSVSVNSNRSGGGNINSNKGSASTPRRVKRHGTVKSPINMERNSGKKNKSTSMESSMPSRWDALKPEHGNGGKINNSAYSHHHANGNTINKKQNQYQQHQRHLRGSSRRGHGMNGNGQSRKGRQNQKSVTNEQPMILRNPVVTSPVSSFDSSLPVNTARSNINEVSPIAATRQKNDWMTWSMTTTANPLLNSYTASPQSKSMPPPPPGFQNISPVHGFEEKNADMHRHQPHANNYLSVPTLFETPLAIRPLFERQQNSFSRASNSIISPEHNSVVSSPDFFSFTGCVSSSDGFLKGSTSAGTMIQENPFSSNVKAISISSNSNNDIVSHHQPNLDSQIEADLQELGGQMAGSILDF